ncbi:hypothetical protein [Actinophytocola sp.]|uniref:hypothetical protein n=1 Tax=Actinophytocola sp. TaxID=1872138 RepID=UPI002ED7BDC5
MPEEVVVSSVEEIRAGRPPEVGVARALLIVVVVLWVPVAGYLYDSTTVGVVVLAMFFVVFGSFGAVKGRQAGRLMTTIALAVTALFLLPYCWLGFRDSNPYGFAYALLDIAAMVLSAIAMSLLYHPNSNRYLHLVTVARQAGRPG